MKPPAAVADGEQPALPGWSFCPRCQQCLPDNHEIRMVCDRVVPRPVPAALDTAKHEVTLQDCPTGLFLSHDGELCVKTSYTLNGRIDAYIVSTGEFFWGRGPQEPSSQRVQKVTPVKVVDVFAWNKVHYDMRRALVSLVGAISLLESGGKEAATSDAAFALMLEDYRRAALIARATLGF